MIARRDDDRRSVSLRSRLSRTFVGLGLVSVVLLAAVNFFVVRDLLDDSTENQLVTLRELRREAIEQGFEAIFVRASTMATDPGVVAALEDLNAGYETLTTELDDEQLAELTASYDHVYDGYDEADVDHPPAESLVPSSTAGRYVQYHYVAENDAEPDDGAALVDAGDGSSYSAAHAEHHQMLTAMAAGIAGGVDLALVSAASDEVIYTVDKHIDIGTDAADGPYAEAGLGQVLEQLSRVSVGDTVVADTEFYVPDGSTPLLHIGAAVRSESEVIGAIVIALRSDALTSILSAEGQWDLLGLGDTGQAYIVGTDRKLRTDPRIWTEDPEEYVSDYLDAGYDDRSARLIEVAGSPVLIQTTDGAAVEAALDGEDFVGVVDNYVDRASLTAAGPLDLPGLDWAIVTEQATSETNAELWRFVRSIAVLLAILLPILAVVGAVLARALAKPVGPLVGAAGRIADGDFTTDVPDLGNNELGDLGRQLRGVAHQLQAQEHAIEQEEARIITMLSSVLPPDLVDRVRRGERDLGETLEIGTVISLNLLGLPEPSGSEQDAVLDLTTRIADDLDQLATTHAVERVRVASDHQLFVAGRHVPDADVPAAIVFATELLQVLRQIGDEFGLPITGHIGLSAGPVATGVLGTHQVSFGVWGIPVGTAIALGNAADAGAIIIDGVVADELDDDLPVVAVEVAGVQAYVIGSDETVEA